MTPKEIAGKIGVSPELVRKWKYRGKWEEELKKPRPGAVRGNRYAVGKGAPPGNVNAVTHGAYSTPRMEWLTEEVKEDISTLEESFRGNALRELKRLETKRADLERRIRELREREWESVEADLVDRKMVMTLPDGGVTEYTNASSPFEWQMRLEKELDKVDGRLLKLLDSIRGQENEENRFELEKQRLMFQKQRISGVFCINEEDEGGNEVVEE